MLASVNAQEEEVPAVPEVPSISEDKEEEKVIKVEIVKKIRLLSQLQFIGGNEISGKYFYFLTADINIFYEKIV